MTWILSMKNRKIMDTIVWTGAPARFAQNKVSLSGTSLFWHFTYLALLGTSLIWNFLELHFSEF
jgi:hypothetical protein